MSSLEPPRRRGRLLVGCLSMPRCIAFTADETISSRAQELTASEVWDANTYTHTYTRIKFPSGSDFYC